MILGLTTQSARIVLGEAKTTTDCQVVTTYAELQAPNTFKQSLSLVNSNGTTPVTIVAAPSAAGLTRDIREVRLFNADTVTHTVTFEIFDGSTAWFVAPAKVSVPANGSFIYTPEAGITVVQSGGTTPGITVVDGNGTTINGVTSLTLAGPTVTGSSPNATATLVPRGYIDGVQITIASTTSFTISAGQATSSDGTTVMNLASAITKLTGGTWVAGNNQNGLDTGTIANGTWYHVYLIFNPTTLVTDVTFSTNATTPSLPSGYTKFRRIGPLRTGVSTAPLFGIIQNGDRFDMPAPVANPSFVGGALGSTLAFLTVMFVPTGVIVEAIVNAVMVDTTGSNTAVWLSNPAQTDTVPAAASGTITVVGQLASISNVGATDGFRVETNISGQIRGRGNSTTIGLFLATSGFIDHRGKQ